MSENIKVADFVAKCMETANQVNAISRFISNLPFVVGASCQLCEPLAADTTS